MAGVGVVARSVVVLVASLLTLALWSGPWLGAAQAATPYTQVAVGNDHSCGLTSSGGAKCWGANGSGRLGDGTTADSGVPVSVQGISTATQLAAGSAHSCAVLLGGSVKCWGANGSGRLGDGTTSDSGVPVSVQGLSTAIQVATGDGHSCAVMSGGSVKCWGANDFGQLGDGSFSDASAPVTVAGISSAIQVATGYGHSCAVLAGGAMKCWGAKGAGRLGDGTDFGLSNVPVDVQGISTATQVAAGGTHSCATLNSGEVKCWGGNAYGQLGNGTTVQSDAPAEVQGVTSGTRVAAGQDHSCAVLAGGVVNCWGDDGSKELGDGGDPSSSTVPVSVQGISTATQVAPNGHCARLSDGAVKCWGYNTSGQLGDGTTTTSGVPVTVQVISTATQVAAGGTHACAVLSGGAVKCWGNGGYGQLGNGSNPSASTEPVDVQGIASATQVAAASTHSCAVLTGGTVKCWGGNAYGQLGNGTTTSSNVPASVQGISTATQVATGTGHSCAVLTDGAIKCWGDGFLGKLGNGGLLLGSNVPVSVQGITTATQVAAGGTHSCARLSDSTLRCWGDNEYGQLGDGTSAPASAVPVSVQGVTTAVDIATGGVHSCAVLSGGSAKCWGYNGLGTLGDGTTTHSNVPVSVQGLATAAQSAGSCALLTGGSVRCWGDGYYGQLGDGRLGFSTTPVAVSDSGGGAVTAPGAPVGVFGVPGDGQVVVSWGAPSSDGGALISGYAVTASPGGQQCVWASGPLSCTVTGLSNGVAYTFSVTATNSAGTGPASAPSGVVTPLSVTSGDPGPGPAPGSPVAGPPGSSAVPSGAAPPVAARLAAPGRSVRVKGGKLAVSCVARSGVISRCTATLTVKGKKVGSVTGRPGRLVLRLNASGRKLLKRARRKLSAVLTLVARSPSGPVRQTKKITLTK